MSLSGRFLLLCRMLRIPKVFRIVKDFRILRFALNPYPTTVIVLASPTLLSVII